jgi:hypothetical protein
MNTPVYIVREKDSHEDRYFVSSEYTTESLQRQIEIVEHIDVEIVPTTMDKLDEKSQKLVDVQMYYTMK